jgi:hypothetical protein
MATQTVFVLLVSAMAMLLAVMMFVTETAGRPQYGFNKSENKRKKQTVIAS